MKINNEIEKKTNQSYKIERTVYLRFKELLKEKKGMKVGTFIYLKIIEFLNEYDDKEKKIL